MAFDPYTQAMHEALDAKKRDVYIALGRIKL